jgi:hypothetical protein
VAITKNNGITEGFQWRFSPVKPMAFETSTIIDLGLGYCVPNQLRAAGAPICGVQPQRPPLMAESQSLEPFD